MDGLKCNTPNCPIDDLEQELQEIKESVNKLLENQNKLTELMVSLKYLSDHFIEFKNMCYEDKKNILERLRQVEQEYVSKKDLFLYSAIVGTLFTLLNYVLKVYT